MGQEEALIAHFRKCGNKYHKPQVKVNVAA